MMGSGTWVALGPSEKYPRRPRLCSGKTAEKSANSSAIETVFRLSIIALGRNGGDRRDAYDTMGSGTWVALGPSEKYHRRPLRVPDPIYLSVYLNRRSLARYRLVRVRGREPTWDL
jgi:hypothetical protein